MTTADRETLLHETRRYITTLDGERYYTTSDGETLPREIHKKVERHPFGVSAYACA